MNPADSDAMQREVAPAALVTTDGPQSSQERFARLFIERKFRILDVAQMMEISPSQAHAMLHDVEVMSHLDRLVTTGEAAVTVAGPREIQEAVTSVIRYPKKEYYGECATLGIKPDPIAFLRLKIDAAMTSYKFHVGPRPRDPRGRKQLTTPAAVRARVIGECGEGLAGRLPSGKFVESQRSI